MRKSEPSDPIVVTGLGSVRGRWHDGAARFLGVPYAEPPVGRLRFRPPVPVAPWAGERDAGEFGATPQRVADRFALIPEPSIAGPDTLSVNIWTPDPGRDARLPVLVYVHGGGYTTGSPASPWYDGRAFARDGVVTVTLSYRLGFDGFGWIDGTTQNRGVLDWLCALRWVHEHIAAFGGDPDRVTIAGQSAGAGAVLTLLGMPEARGLVAGAWAASPAITDVSETAARAFSARMARLLGVPATLAGFSRLGEREILRAQPRARKTRSLDAFAAVDRGLAVGPTIDGDVLRTAALPALGDGAPVPLVLGAMHDEFALATPLVPRPLRPIAPWLLRAIPGSAVLAAARVPRRARSDYLAANGDASSAGVAAIASRFASDLVFGGTVVAAAESRQWPTWAYRFDWASPVRGFAVHCLDVPFAFDRLDAPGVARLAGDDPPQALADALHGAMVRFATDGDPGWASWTSRRGATRLFGGTQDVDEHGWSRVAALAEAGVTPRRARR